MVTSRMRSLERLARNTGGSNLINSVLDTMLQNVDMVFPLTCTVHGGRTRNIGSEQEW